MPELQSPFLVSEMRIATGLMLTLKEIAAKMDCSTRNAKIWWKKIDRLQEKAGLPRVAPDQVGHGAHKWKERTATRLVKLYNDFYSSRGTTLQIVRAKYAGDLDDPHQLNLFPIPNFNVKKNHNQKAQAFQTSRPCAGKAAGRAG